MYFCVHRVVWSLSSNTHQNSVRHRGIAADTDLNFGKLRRANGISYFGSRSIEECANYSIEESYIVENREWKIDNLHLDLSIIPQGYKFSEGYKGKISRQFSLETIVTSAYGLKLIKEGRVERDLTAMSRDRSPEATSFLRRNLSLVRLVWPMLCLPNIDSHDPHALYKAHLATRFLVGHVSLENNIFRKNLATKQLQGSWWSWHRSLTFLIEEKFEFLSGQT